MPRTAFVFAHPDDAALSAFRALSKAGGRGLDIVVCGGAPARGRVGTWDASCGFVGRSEARRVRRSEHGSVCRALRLHSVILDHADRQYSDSSEADWTAAVERCAEECSRWDVTALVSHRSKAFHEDHARTAVVVAQLARRLEIPLVTVCDRPYVDCSSAGCDAGDGVLLKLTDAEWSRKKQALAAYASQHRGLQKAFGTGWRSRGRLGWECYELGVVR